MEPIVHGLNQEYEGRLAFERVDAVVTDGRRRMETYGLRGHPAYVLADPDGEALWVQMGLTDAQTLRNAIERFLAAPGQ